jgi:hypothetical protein
MSGTAGGENGGGTPSPHFCKTIPEAPARRGPGAPFGNRNAVKHGRHTAEMRALRAEVRFAVLKARALAALAWASPPMPAKHDENGDPDSTGRRRGGQ